MKRYFLAILFYLLLAANAVAQQSALGISMGSGISNTYHDNFSKEAGKRAFILDLNYQLTIAQHFTIKSGLSLERKGSQHEPFWCPTGEETNPYNVHFDYSYATVPLLPGVTFGKKIRYNVYCGPYFSFLLKRKLTKNDEFRNDVIVKQASNQKNIDFGLTSGAGIEIPIFNKFFIPIEFRYNLGLMNISNERLYYHEVLLNETYSEDMVVKHTAWYVMIGLKTYIGSNR